MALPVVFRKSRRSISILPPSFKDNFRKPHNIAFLE
jgi:hypothetical protein